jgi:hypothetical protein
MKPRPFGLTDAMILVVAVAAGLSVNRLNWAGFVDRWRQPIDAHDSIETFLALVAPQLAAGTIATLVLRMRNPRPSFRRIAREPGSAACTVALAAFVVIACWVGLITAMGRSVEFSEHLTKAGVHTYGSAALYPLSGRILVAYGDRIAFAIAGAWLAVCLSGRWRPEPTWLDRLGRTMGWLWLPRRSALAPLLFRLNMQSGRRFCS